MKNKQLAVLGVYLSHNLLYAPPQRLGNPQKIPHTAAEKPYQQNSQLTNKGAQRKGPQTSVPCQGHHEGEK